MYHRDNYSSESSAAGLNNYDHPDPYGSYFPAHLPDALTSQPVFPGQPDTDSDHEVYGQHLGSSGRSLNGGRCSTPNLGDFGAPQYNTGRERYLAWGNERSIPLSKEEIEDIFLDLQQKQRPDFYGLLSRSLAPSAWAMDDV